MVCGGSVPCLCAAGASSASNVGRILMVWTVTALLFGPHGFTALLFVSQLPPWTWTTYYHHHPTVLSVAAAVPLSSSSWTNRPMSCVQGWQGLDN